MNPIRTAVLGLALLDVSGAVIATAAGHRDWTPVPLGSFRPTAGEQTITVSRPYDRFGVIPAPVAFTVLYEPRAAAAPFEIQLACGDVQLPAWQIERLGQLYVLGLELLDQAARMPGGDPQTITLRVKVDRPPPGLTLMASGMPDLKLAGDSARGPLEALVKQLDRGPAREYLNAVAALAVGQETPAAADLERLARGPDEDVARFARAALRRLRFAAAEAGVPNTFAAHYAFGLYAQQCGLFRAARVHFETALAAAGAGGPRIDPATVSAAWFRLGEMMERCGEPPESVAEVMERAGRAGGVTPNTWDVWVVILLAKEYPEERDGQKVPVLVRMTPEQIAKIRREWHWVEQMVYGASGGHFKLNTRYVEVPDESVVPYGIHAGWLYGPRDELVPIRGSVDCVMSFHPRGPSVTGGADCGPNGAALTDIGTWCGWEVCLHEWNHQFDWTVRTDEAGDGYPITHHSDSCGHQPIPSMGYGHRASMHYYVTPAMYRRIEPADPDNGEGYLVNWGIGEPMAIAEAPPAQDTPSHHVLDFPPDRAATQARRGFDLEGEFKDFIDLKSFFAARGLALPPWCVTPATTFVYSPRPQEVRFWLGHNDGMAVWLNGELIHRGDYYAIAKFEDQNRPNMVAIAGVLSEGANRLDVVVESWPAPRDQGHGFSVRVCDFKNRPVPGVRAEHGKLEVFPRIVPPVKPAVGRLYAWDEVRDDFYFKLPELTAEGLAGYAGLPSTFKISGSIGPTQGFVALGSDEDRDGAERGGVPLRPVPKAWDRAQDRDTRLNNLLDWNREALAVYPFGASDPRTGQRHLLVMRPEAIEAYLTCLRESPDAAARFRDRTMRDRVLGYIKVGEQKEDDGVRVLIVAETCLPTPLPADEEDLLTPGPG